MDWSVEQLKVYFDNELKQRDIRYDLQFRHDQEQTDAAAKALQIKLNGMNEFRAALNDATVRNISREDAENRINSLAEKIEATIKPLEDKIETVRRPNWTLLSVLASVAVAAVAGVWMVIGLQISNAETPIALNVSQIKEQNAARDRTITDNSTSIAAITNQLNERLRSVEEKIGNSAIADEQSRTDRSQLNVRLRDMENAMSVGTADRRAAIASINAALIEIETQFCSSDVTRNLMHANDMRIQSMLWSRTHDGESLPTDNAYYPVICHGGTGNVK